MNKITILGGSGFIGSHLADYLSKMNFKVTLFDIKKSPWLKKNQKMIIGDILDKKKLSLAIKGSDYIFNFEACFYIVFVGVPCLPLFFISFLCNKYIYT